MKKRIYIIFLAGFMLFSLTACKNKVERVKSKEDNKIEIQEETNDGYTKEELEEGTLPEDVFDENDYSDNQQNGENITEEEIEEGLEEITDNYNGDGAIILPEDVFK